MNAVTETPNPATAPLWERTRAMFARAVAAVGAPAAIAALTLLSRATRGDLVRWLLLLESIVRKLLLADAGALSPPSKRTGPRLIVIPLHGVAPAANQTPVTNAPHQSPRLRTIDFAQPETWAAQFALSLPHSATVPESRAPRIRTLGGYPPPPPPPPALRRRRAAAFLLARRFEALRRVLNDPLPHVQRLALALRSAVYRCRDIVTRYFSASPRKYGYDAHDPRLRIEAFGQAYDAQFAFVDTS